MQVSKNARVSQIICSRYHLYAQHSVLVHKNNITTTKRLGIPKIARTKRCRKEGLRQCQYGSKTDCSFNCMGRCRILVCILFGYWIGRREMGQGGWN